MNNIFLFIVLCSFGSNKFSEFFAEYNYYCDTSIEESIQYKNSIYYDKEVFHLFTHGSPGSLLIENQWKSPQEIATWLKERGHLKNITHLNVYGCNFAKGKKGRAAVDYLEQELCITIAASDDITGIDGDWELEVGTPVSSIVVPDYPYNLQQATLPLQQGQVVFTCECTSPTSNVLAVMDISCPDENGATTGSTPETVAYWDEPVATGNFFDGWTCDVLGSVSPLATDEELGIGVESIYVGASGLDLSQNVTPSSLTTSPTGSEIFCIDGQTGAPRLLTSLPGSIYTESQPGPANLYFPGIQQIAYNSDIEVVYASNGDDGLIYAIDPVSGATLGTFDHGLTTISVADDPNAAMTQMNRYVGAVQYNPCDSKLYYATVTNPDITDWPYYIPGDAANEPTSVYKNQVQQIWCVQVDAAGVPTGSPTLFDSWSIDIVNRSAGIPVIYDIAFTNDCANQRMTASTRAMRELQGDAGVNDNFLVTNPHIGDQQEWTSTGGVWDLNEQHIAVGYYDNDARGLDYGSNLFTSCSTNACPNEDSRVTLTDRIFLHQCSNGADCPSYGFTITPLSYTTGTGAPTPFPDYTQMLAVDIDGNFTDGFNDKSAYYDLEFLSTPTCPSLEATVSNDQFKCLGVDFDPMEVTAISPSTGLTYQWQMSTTSCAEGFTDVSGATSATYTPPTVLAADTVYYRAAVVWAADCADIGNCERFSDCITIGSIILTGPDKDGDGVPDEYDADVDNDGIPDHIEQMGLLSLATPGVNGEPSPNDICATSPQQLTYNINVPGTTTTIPVSMGVDFSSDCNYAIVDPPGTSASEFLIDGVSFTTDGDPSPPYIEITGGDREILLDWGVAANSLDVVISDCETANYRYIIGVAGNEIIDVNASATELAIFPYEQFQVVGYQDAFNTGVYNSNGGAVTDYGDGTWFVQGEYNPQFDDTFVGQQTGYTWYTIDPSLSEVGMYIQGPTSGSFGLIFGIIRSFEKDTDCDGIANHIDLDSDNDGIPDAVEACGDISLTLEDCMLDNNGDENYIIDPVIGCATGVIVGSCTQPMDTDGDGIPDYMDLDSDGDGCSDAAEAGTDGVTGVSINTYSAGTVDACGLLVDNGTPQCNVPSDTNWISDTVSGAECSVNIDMPLNCSDPMSGAVTVSPTGDSYTWSHSAAETGASVTGLGAGTYTVTVTIAGCESVCSVTLDEPANCCSIACDTPTITNVTCNGGADGSATANYTGALGNVSYLWDATAGNATTQTVSGLSAGTYSVTITDDVSPDCESICSVTITEPAGNTCTVSNDGPYCEGEVITITAVGDGTISWGFPNGSVVTGNPLVLNNATTNMSGTYTAVVTDANGCSSECETVVTVNPNPSCTVSTTAVTCNGEINGSVTANVTGGTAGYTYLWDAAAGNATTQTVSSLASGTYTVTVTDLSGCTTVCAGTISEPVALSCSLGVINPDCAAMTGGSITVTPTGGVSPYEYSLDGTPFQIGETFSNLESGTYIVTVRDANGCTSSCEATLIAENCIFDLALEKTLATSGLVSPGDLVTFNIEVCNQGTVDAYNVELDDYYNPAELVLADTDWTDAGATGTASINNEIDFISAGDCAIVTIDFTVHVDFMGTMIINYAEITAADDDDDSTNTAPVDADSTPGDNAGDDELANDGETVDTDDGSLQDDDADSDDYDPAPLMIGQVFDLALTKVINTTATPGPYAPGSTVQFTITVYNQGTLDAYDIDVADYNPTGLSAPTLVGAPAGITQNAAGDWTIDFVASNMGTGSYSFEVEAVIDPAFMGTELINDAEIAGGSDTDGGSDTPDVDSTPGDDGTPDDTANDNDTNDTTGGDDQDPALVPVSPVFDLALTKVINTTATPGPYAPGSTVQFTITVYNQGDLDAFDVDVADYNPVGLSVPTLVAGQAGVVENAPGDFTVDMVASNLGTGSFSFEVEAVIDANFMGTSLINDAEITGGSDTDGGPDTPDVDSTPDDNDTPDDLANDNDVDDQSGGDDQDPAEVTVEQIFDLALEKTLATSGLVSPGDLVTFNIEVCNQGTLDAYNVELDDYYNPAELVLADTDWTDAGATGTASINNEIDFIATGNCAIVTIDFTVHVDFMGTMIINYAEITAADDDDDSTNTAPVDADSTPGDNAGDDELANDGETVDTDDGSLQDDDADSDDYDPAPLMIGQVFDLALTKVINTTATPGPYAPGSTVQFTITVYNQGTLDAYDIDVADYNPTGLSAPTLVGAPAGITQNAAGDWTIDFVASNMGTGSYSFEVEAVIDPAFMGTELINDAEITGGSDTDGGSDTPDVDSTPGDDGTPDDTANDNDTNDTTGGDDQDPALVPVSPVFDLALTKVINTTATPGPYGPGSTVQFTITVYNQGDLDAFDVDVADYNPVGLSVPTLVAGQAGVVENAPGDFTVDMVASNLGTGSFSFEVEAVIDANFMGTSLINDAEITGGSDTDGGPDTPDVDSTPDDNDTPDDLANDNDVDDINGGDDQDPAEVTVEQIFDLALEKTLATSGLVSPGDLVTFNIEVCNQGTLDAYNVELDDYYNPAELVLADTDWTDAGATGTASINNEIDFISAGDCAIVTIDFTVHVDFMGTMIINYAEITAADDDDDSTNTAPVDADSTPGDNAGDDELANDGETVDTDDGSLQDDDADSDDYDPAPLMIGQVFDLALTKVINTTATPGPYAPGSTVQFTITVYNQGTLDAYDIDVADYNPTGLSAPTLVGAPAGITQNAAGDWTIDFVASNMGTGSYSFEVEAVIDPAFMGTELINDAEITGGSDTDGGSDTPDVDSTPGDDGTPDDTANDNDTNDTTGGDDQDPALVPVSPVFDLALTKVINTTATPGPYAPGSTVQFTITVYNQGDLDAFDVDVADYNPVGLSVPTLVAGQAGVVENAPGDFTVDMVASNLGTGSFSFEVEAVIDANFMGTSLINDAEITGGSDTDGGPDTPDVDSTPDDNDTPDDLANDNDVDDQSGGDDQDPAEVTVEQIFDLALEKTLATSGLVSPGDLVTFNIEVCNQGTLDAYNVELDDYYNPAELVLADTDWTDAGATGTASINNEIDFISAGDCAIVTIDFTVHVDFMGTMIINYAEITAADDDDDSTNTAPVDADSTPGDNAGDDELANDGETVDTDDGSLQDDDADSDDYDPAPLMIGQVFDLALTKVINTTATPGPYAPGSTVQFTITVYNQGTLDAYDIDVADYNPTGLSAPTLVGAPAGITQNAAGDWTIDFVASNMGTGSYSFEVEAVIDPAFMGTELINDAEITGGSDTDGGSDTPDVDSTPGDDGTPDDTANDNDTNDTTGGDDQDPALVPVSPVFDLALTKVINTTATPGPYAPGSTVQFTITVYNQGDLDAFDVDVADYNPVGLSVPTLVAGQAGVVENAPGDFTVDMVASNLGTGSFSFEVEAVIDANFMGTSLINDAEITGGSDTDGGPDTPDVDSTPDDNDTPDDLANDNDVDDQSGGDDQDPAEVTVEQIFDLALEKTLATSGLVSPGDLVTFNIEVCNQGTLDAYNVELDDYYNPAELVLADTDWTDAGATGTASINNEIDFISAGDCAIVTIDFTVHVDFMGTMIINYAEITAADDDDDSTNTAPVDADSTPGDNAGDDELANDGETVDTDDGSLQDDDADSDDYDPAPLMIGQVFDLALTKVINTTATPGPYAPGSTVQFTITVYNQGTLDAYDIDVADYNPTGLSAPTLVGAPAGITQNAAGDWTIDFVASNMGTGSYSFEVEAVIDPAFMGTELINDAEITGGSDTDGGSDTPDVDSTPGDDGTPDDTANDNDTNDTTGGDDQDPALVPVSPVFDLALTKVINTTATPGPYAPGSTVQFTITVYNQGDLDAFDVDVADYNPVGLSVPTLVAGQAGVVENAPGDFTVDMVASNLGTGSFSFEVEAVIDANFMGTSLINDAEITGGSDTDGGPDTPDVDSTPDDNDTPDDLANDNDVDDQSGGDDQDPAEVTVEQIFDLALEKTLATSGLVSPGDLVTFNIEVCNQGTLDAYNVELDDYYNPAELVLADTDWTDAGATGTASINNEIDFISAGDCAIVTIDFTVHVDFMGTMIINYAEITAADDDDDSTNTAPVDADSTPGDNAGDDELANDGETVDTDDGSLQDDDADSDDYDPAPLMIGQVFDLALTKVINTTATPGPYAPGSTVQFTITVYNQGTLDAYDIDVADYNPTGLSAPTLVGAPSGITQNAAGDWTIDFVASNLGTGSYSFEVEAVIDANFMGSQLINDAEITGGSDTDGGSDTPDVDSTPGDDGTPDDTANDNDVDDTTGGDDQDPAVVNIGQTFDLALTKVINTTATPGPYAPGSTVQFTITVYNQGTVDAYDVDVADYNPTGLSAPTLVGAPAGITQNAAGNWTIDFIASNLGAGSYSFEVEAVIDANFMGTSLINDAEITGGSDTDGGTDTDDVDSEPGDDDTPDDLAGDNDVDDQSGGDDQDPAEVTVEQIFDLALEKTLLTSGLVSPGSSVTFNVEVCNQGTVDAYNVFVDDYYNVAELILNDAAWTADGAGVASLNNDIAFIGVDECQSVPITFTVSPSFMGTSIVNYAEITGADDDDDSSNGFPTDADSTPGDNEGDDELANDGETVDSDTGSEQDDDADSDDYDPAPVTVTQVFDLALTKVINTTATPGPYAPGSTVQFTITVYNQGTIDAYDVDVADYNPTGLSAPTLVGAPAGITQNAAGDWTIDFVASNLGTGSYSFEVEAVIDANFMGSQLINDAEITGGSDTDGGSDTPDVDSTPGDDGTPDDTANDNDVDDTTGGDDQDPAVVNIGQTFDLALTKVINTTATPGPYAPGSTVQFTITVYNQGTVDAYDVDVADYNPTGLSAPTLVGAPAGITQNAAGNWTIDFIASNLGAGSYSFEVEAVIDANFMGTSLINDAEITGGSDTDGGTDTDDIDSEPGDDDTPDDLAGDNDVDDQSGGDDQDPAEVTVEQIFDLALEKTLATSGLVSPGDAVTFNVEVCNQGTLDAYNVELDDYYNPAELVLVDTDWTDAGATGTASINNDIPFIGVGECVTVAIDFTVHVDFMGTMIINYAEITAADDDDDSTNTAPVDADSTPGDNAGDDELANDGETVDSDTGSEQDDDADSDDYDPAPVTIIQVFDVALVKDFDSWDDTNNDGFISQGENVTYTITVYNQGNLDAQNLEVTDYIPTSMLFNAVDNTDFSGMAPTVVASIANLASGSSEVLTITLQVDPMFMGAMIVNNAEITQAENLLGVEDEDDPIGNIDGFSDDGSELDTDGDVDDESTGVPGDMDNPEDIDDYDPEMIQIGQIFDLALLKVYDSYTDLNGDGVLSPGDDVTFRITIINQGTLDAYNVQISDYIPDGLELNDPAWNNMQNVEIAQLNNVIDFIAADDQMERTITFSIDEYWREDTITNWAEISAADDNDDPTDRFPEDFDSTSDSDPDDDTFGGDNAIDNSNNDEDDSDPAAISPVIIFDLALAKIDQSDEPLSGYGETRTFDIEVTNQGTVNATVFTVVDYIPCGFEYPTTVGSNPGWTYNPTSNTAEFIYDETILAPGASVTLEIDLVTVECAGDLAANYTNYAEISDYDDDFNDFNADLDDIDSDPDATNFDDAGGVPWTDSDDYIDGDGTGVSGVDNPGVDTSDEDDHDPEIVEIFDLALIKTLATPAPYAYGDLLEFTITVCNQGNIGAQNILVGDYLPVGYSFDFADNAGWGGALTAPTYLITDLLAVDVCEDIPIFLTVEMTSGGEKDWINYAEILAAENQFGDDRTNHDIDSNPGSDSVTENDVEPGDLEDNDLTSQDKGGEEDDHDPAGIEIFDLAQTKTTAQTGPFKYGDVITFTVTVFNQGSVQASNIGIVDYIPCGYEYVDSPGWIYDATTHEATYIYAANLAPGASETIDINLALTQCLDNDASTFTNYTEITNAESDDPDVLPDDIDSTPDNDPDNDGPETDNETGGDPSDTSNPDEDDHDLEVVAVFDLAQNKIVDNVGPYVPGEKATFTIEVFNQGNVTAQNFTITDYLNTGFIYNAVDNSGWVQNGNLLTYDVNTPLLPDASTTIDLILEITIPTGANPSVWINESEISYAEDTDGNNTDDGTLVDVDSDPDQDPDNDNDVQPEDDNDNVIDENISDPFGAGDDDEDDNDIAHVIVGYDLALTKTKSGSGPYSFGQIIPFNITVYNQGGLAASNIQVTDYIPCGYVFDQSLNPDWSYDSATGYATTTIEEVVLPFANKVEVINLIVQPCETSDYTNYAEISDFDDENGNDPLIPDYDSTPDNDPDNDGLLTDDEIDGSPTDPSNPDEDDHDSEDIEVFDLAIQKTVADTEAYAPGDIAVFTITVHNQGNIDAYDIEVTDYLNVGYIFTPGGANAGWSASGDYAVYVIDGPLAPGTSQQITLSLEVQVPADASAHDWYNEAEISFATSVDGSGVNTVDADSTPDNDPDNDNDLMDGSNNDNDNEIDENINDPFNNGDDDEDDNDAAEITVVGKLCGVIWSDCNGDGVQNDFNSGMAGVVVDVFNEDHVLMGSVITNNSGFYELENLLPGLYYVKVHKPAEFYTTDFKQGTILNIDSDINDANGECTTPMAYVRGGECDKGDFDAGLYECIPIGELVWYDINKNDVKEPFENGINGLPVELWKLENGVWNWYETKYTGHKPGTPSDDGYFKFCAPPGTYEVRIDLPEYGLVPTRQNMGTNGSLPLTNSNESAFDSDVNFGQSTGAFTVDCNTGDVCNIGAGYYPMAQVGNRVWADANEDGMQSTGEQGIAGVLVQAYDANDNMINSTTTDASGEYMIDYLGADDYYLKFTPPSNYLLTLAKMGGDDNTDSDVDGSNGLYTTPLISLNSGDSIPTVDAGLIYRHGVVPIELLSFTGKHIGHYNLLEWETAREVNSSHFVVERSLNSTTDFVELGKVMAAGNSSEVISYDMRDYDIELAGGYYYRLKLVDIDETSSYSETVRIDIERAGEYKMDLYPNPARSSVNLDIDIPTAGMVKVSIWDAQGKLVATNVISEEMTAGLNTRTLDIRNYAAGMYSVKIEVGNTFFKKKLIILKD